MAILILNTLLKVGNSIKFQYLGTIIILIMSFVCSLDVKQGHSHNFDTDDNSTFLTLINQILIETRLLNNSLYGPHFNLTNSVLSVDNILDLIDEITISEDSFIVDSDQFYNNTIMATVVANLADEVLRSYGSAHGVPSNIMLSMDFGNVINHSMHNVNQSIIQDSPLTENKSSLSPNNLDYSNIKLADHNKAKAISERMVEIYQRELVGPKSNSNEKTPLSNLGISLLELNDAVGNITSPVDVMKIVHTKIHPYLQLAFNLTLKR